MSVASFSSISPDWESPKWVLNWNHEDTIGLCAPSLKEMVTWFIVCMVGPMTLDTVGIFWPCSPLRGSLTQNSGWRVQQPLTGSRQDVQAISSGGNTWFSVWGYPRATKQVLALSRPFQLVRQGVSRWCGSLVTSMCILWLFRLNSA